jgi:hypothetical protein
MLRWCWPDGFIGDDPTSKRNARWLGFFIALYLLLAFGTAACFAQGVILQAGPATQGHAPAYANPSQAGSQAVVLDSGPAGGGGPGVGLSELNVTARGAGTGPNGEVACIQDAPTNSPTGYHYLCLSGGVSGNGVISYGAGGTATPGILIFIINGVLVTPVSCTGTPTSSFAAVNGIVTHC